ncbi:MAG: B12-binding domain-containing radical SAM protein [Desulfuromonadaceae bacterium]
MKRRYCPDVLLVQPPYGGHYTFWKSECLGMGYLASALEARGYSVEILDAFLLDLDVETVVGRILDAPPNLLLGFSMLSYELFRTGEAIIRQLRALGFTTHVTLGSWFPTFWYQSIIDEGVPVDSIVLAEGERSICSLTDYLRDGSWSDAESYLDRELQPNGVLVLRQKCTLADVDLLPHPRRDYLPQVFQKYHLATSYTARGCGHSRCTFCSVPAFYQGGAKHRLRSANNVIDEVETISKLGANFLFFSDEDFLGLPPQGTERALMIFEGVAERKIAMRYAFNCTAQMVDEGLFRRLRDLGLAAVYIGMESSVDRMLKLFGKSSNSSGIDRAVGILRDLGIKLVPGWIMFERQTTLDEVESQIQFLNGIDAYHVNYLKSLYVMKDTGIERIYADSLYKSYYHNIYFFEDPDVDLLVRILTTDYLPETMPYTANIYPVWHKLLAGDGTAHQQRQFDSINSRIKEFSLGFTSELIIRIRNRSLDGVARSLTEQVQLWRLIGDDIDSLAADLTSEGGEVCAE